MLLNPQEESLISQLFFEEFKAVTYQKEKSNHQIFSFFIFSSSFFLHDCIMISLSLSLSLCQLNILSSSSIQTYKSSKSRNWVTTQNIFTWLKVLFFFFCVKRWSFSYISITRFPILDCHLHDSLSEISVNLHDSWISKLPPKLFQVVE